MIKNILRFASFIVSTTIASAADAPKPESSGQVAKEVQNLKLPQLMSATSVAIPPDGKFLYAAAFNASAITTFKRNQDDGKIELDDTITGPDLRAAVSLRLSENGDYAVASAFVVNAITLFKREANSGRLKQLDVARQGENGNSGLRFVIDAEFAPDNRYLYTASAEGVGVFKLEGDKLSFLQIESADNKLNGLRDVAMSPDGRFIYAVAPNTSTLAVLRPDSATGKVEVLQILTDGDGGATALEGAFRIACSPKGEHVYVSAGRFGGDQAVSVFSVQPDGKLKVVEEHVNGTGDFKEFMGGNSLAVSPDGQRLYALATISDRVARFQRDPATGKLTFDGSQPVGDHVEPGCPGLCFSPDGRFVYIADENASAIVVLQVP